MENSSVVIIIGAGVAGLSTAYHLALNRPGRVIMLDEATIGDGSCTDRSWIAGGSPACGLTF